MMPARRGKRLCSVRRTDILFGMSDSAECNSAGPIDRTSVFRCSAALSLLATLLACLSFAPYLRAQSTPTSSEPPRDLTVLILGDSLSLCGFGKRLDQKFRGDPRVKSVFTYCTCGTNPLSWLKEKPYAHVQTHCGYLSIESLPNSHAIKELRDIYWVAPPTSGRVPGEVQEFVFEQTQNDIGSVTHVIDGRKLVVYPYKHMEPDKEHFVGEDMDKLTDKVFVEIDRDLSAQPWSD